MNQISLLFILFATSARAQDSILLQKWKSYAFPDNKTVHKYNLADNADDWIVFMKNNHLFTTKERRDTTSKLPFRIQLADTDLLFMPFGFYPEVMEVGDGYLLSTCQGEWGGVLFWFSKDGRDHYKISPKEGIVQFIRRDDTVYAIPMGDEHKGRIVKIINDHGRWTSIEYIEIAGAPEAIAVQEQGDFLVMTLMGLYRIDRHKRIETLIEHRPVCWWHWLFPTSLVIKDNIAYSGMREGILKFNLSTHKQSWLRKN